MKILISVDIEGVAGVTHAQQVRPGNPEYEQARRWMTAEADAAARGALAGGADVVIVNDSHGGFRNLLRDQLDDRIQLISGKPRNLGMMSGVPGCDAVFLVGYHAGASCVGVLAHTINSFAFRRVRVNGDVLNEAGLYGAVAAEYGVPVALMSGDDAFIAETRDRFPDALAVQTKKAIGQSGAVSLSPAQACARLHEAAVQAVGRLGGLAVRPPRAGMQHCELEVQTPGLADLFCQWPSLRRLDAVTLAFEGDSMEAVVRQLNCLSAMSFMLR